MDKEKNERVRAQIKANGNDEGHSYDILDVGDQGYMVRSSSGAESPIVKSQRLVYSIARHAAREGDNMLIETESLEAKMRANVGSGRQRDPVAGAQNRVKMLEEREQKLTQKLADCREQLKMAKASIKEAEKEAKRLAAEKEAKAKEKEEAAAKKAAEKEAKAKAKAEAAATAAAAGEASAKNAKGGKSSKQKAAG